MTLSYEAIQVHVCKYAGRDVPRSLVIRMCGRNTVDIETAWIIRKGSRRNHCAGIGVQEALC